MGSAAFTQVLTATGYLLPDGSAAPGLTRAGEDAMLGMPRPKVSAIRNYKLRGISLERLMQALLALGQQVEIVVTPSRRAGEPIIRVAA